MLQRIRWNVNFTRMKKTFRINPGLPLIGLLISIILMILQISDVINIKIIWVLFPLLLDIFIRIVLVIILLIGFINIMKKEL